jgi:hypothetical protein
MNFQINIGLQGVCPPERKAGIKSFHTILPAILHWIPLPASTGFFNFFHIIVQGFSTNTCFHFADSHFTHKLKCSGVGGNDISGDHNCPAGRRDSLSFDLVFFSHFTSPSGRWDRKINYLGVPDQLPVIQMKFSQGVPVPNTPT